ncbi:MAG: ComF family protein [Acidobacteria bacterium]|nr:ComF family protein [Acidobacteriota bacterium]
MIHLVRTIFDPILSTILPEQCRVCVAREADLAGGVVCEHCWDAAPLFTNETPVCSKCSTPLDVRTNMHPKHCGSCEEFAFDRTFACGTYDGAIAGSVIALKTRPVIPGRLREVIRNTVRRIAAWEFGIIIPVPLSRKREHERGFNQAEKIARVVSRYSGVPVCSNALQRTVHTPMHRAGMDDRAREMTVEKAFSVVRPELIRDKSILLVDDVMTSGATADACASILKKNGASSLIVLTIARAVRSA